MTLAEAAAEIGLTAEEEEAVRTITKETTDAFFKLLADEDNTVEDIHRQFEEAKDNLAIMTAALSQIVKRYRVGLVTFNDVVVQNVPLTKNVARLHGVLLEVQAKGGQDIPEGGDKALLAALGPEFGYLPRQVLDTQIAAVLARQRREVFALLGA